MSLSIKSGNSGQVATVDGNKRLHVEAVSRDDAAEATVKGDSYNLNTGSVTLTSASASAVAYLKNDDTRQFRIDAIIVILGPSTSGVATEGVGVTIVKNPTAFSTSTAGDINQNRNFGSGKTFTSTFYKGAEAATITGGDNYILSIVSSGARTALVDLDTSIDPGNSIAISIDPQGSNSNMLVQVAFIGHLEDPQENGV